MLNREKILNWFNPLNKRFTNLPREAQEKILGLSLNHQATNTARELFNKLESKRTASYDRVEESTAKAIQAFTLFRQLLPNEGNSKVQPPVAPDEDRPKLGWHLFRS